MTSQINTQTYKDTYYGNGMKKNNLTRIPISASGGRFSVPPIDEITGESIMPSDYPLVPLIPAVIQDNKPQQGSYHSQDFLRQHIGHWMRVEFLIGANGALIDRTGKLVQVGDSFIVLQAAGSDDLLMCDLYSIKFVTIYR